MSQAPLEDLESVADLRRQVRAWRRARAELTWWEVAQDAYAAVFSVVLVGAMVVSVVLGLRDLGDRACTEACAAVRTTVPWLALLVALVLALGAARLLGPVFLPPATVPWLVSTPLDRADLLRPALVRALVAAGLGAAALVVGPAALSGAPAATVALACAGAGALAVAVVGLAAHAQVARSAAPRLLTWALVAITWAALAVVTLGAALLPRGDPAAWPGWVLLAAGTALALWAARRAMRALGRTPRTALTATQDAWPSLSGALAAMDVALLYDVLLSRRWAAVAGLRSRRGGPAGWWALVHRDLRRALRSPQPWLVLAGLLVVPYAVASAGLERGAAVVVALCGFLAGPATASGLRVVCRTPTLARTFPLPTWQVRAAHLVVPGVGLLAFAAASLGALVGPLGWREGALAAAAAGAGALAATIRFLASPPPNYAVPLVSTPMGGLPPGMLVGLVKGVDVWLVTSLPILFGHTGALVSLAISAAVVGGYTASTR